LLPQGKLEENEDQKFVPKLQNAQIKMKGIEIKQDQQQSTNVNCQPSVRFYDSVRI
jgi:hypothetical protein